MIVRTALKAQRTLNMECVQNLIKEHVAVFAASPYEHLGSPEIGLNYSKHILHQIGVFAGTGTVTDDLLIEKIHQQVGVVPPVVYS